MSLSADHSYGPSIKGSGIGKSNRQDLVLINTPTWLDQARCRGAIEAADLVETKGGAHDFIRRYCSTCPVRRECYQKGVEIKAVSTVWGGVWFTTDGLPAHNTQGETAC